MQNKDTAIVLTRTDFSEKDRILTVLGEKSGKTTLIAKSVRSANSKLAGSIELFGETEVQFAAGKGKMQTLTGARLKIHYTNIQKNLDNTIFGYEMLKLISKVCEEGNGQEFYDLLKHSMGALEDEAYGLGLAKTWFFANLLRETGHLPNLKVDDSTAEEFEFDIDSQKFVARAGALFRQDHIKLMRVMSTASRPSKVKTSADVAEQTAKLLEELVRLQLY